MPMLTIRREEPEDAEAVARVHIRGWQAGYAGIMPDELLRRLNVTAWGARGQSAGPPVLPAGGAVTGR